MWEWQDATWHRLNGKDASVLEKAYLQDPAGCWPLLLGPHESCYEVDFSLMKQRSRNGRVRNLRRKEAAPLIATTTEPAVEEIPPIPPPMPEMMPATEAKNWTLEFQEAMGRAEAVVEECQVEVGGFAVAAAEKGGWQDEEAETSFPSDFGSLQSLKRSVESGRAVLVKGSWLALALQPVSRNMAHLPQRNQLPPEAIWGHMDSLDESTAPKRLVVVSHCDDQDTAGTLAQLLSCAAGRQLNGRMGEELGVFLDNCSLECSSDALDWRESSEWFASPFTTKWLLGSLDDARGRRLWERHLATLRCSQRVFQVDELLPTGPLDQWQILATPQVTPNALDVLLEAKSFQQDELGLAKALYREAFSSSVASQQVMDCYTLGWDDFHMLQLAEVLIHCKSLVKLILAENRIGDFGLETLAPRLPETLEILDLSNNCFGDDGLTRLARHLPPRLRQLCLSSNHFREPGMDALMQSLPQCLQLRSLHMARVPLAGACLSQLAKLQALRHLCLNEAHLACEGMLQLSLPTSLEELLLDGNSLGDAGLRMLIPKLPPNLQLLSLSENGLRDAGLRSLASTLRLRTLRVHSNHLTPQVLQEPGLWSQTEVLALHQRA